MSDNKTCRVAVFYDGTFFAKVSNYYLYQHPRKARISINGLHEFIRETVADEESCEKRHVQVVDALYFRGRFTAKSAQARNALYSDRAFEDVLLRANVTLHQELVVERNGQLEEKRVDVSLALEAYEMASLKRYDVCVLLTGDGDFVPLVRKLHTLGSRVMLLAWDFEYENEGVQYRTRTSQELIDCATYKYLMAEIIDARDRRNDPVVNGLFLRHDPAPASGRGAEGPSPPDEDILEDGQISGGIASLVADKGYGFIKPDGGGNNLFFHANDVVGVPFSSLQKGDQVVYLTKQGDRGDLVAFKVTKR